MLRKCRQYFRLSGRRVNNFHITSRENKSLETNLHIFSINYMKFLETKWILHSTKTTVFLRISACLNWDYAGFMISSV